MNSHDHENTRLVIWIEWVERLKKGRLDKNIMIYAKTLRGS